MSFFSMIKCDAPDCKNEINIQDLKNSDFISITIKPCKKLSNLIFDGHVCKGCFEKYFSKSKPLILKYLEEYGYDEETSVLLDDKDFMFWLNSDSKIVQNMQAGATYAVKKIKNMR